tara:strand:+ start:1370 stop:2212 length:843 start_codon:yes stop_codon:yes gene_type:complete
MGFLRKVGRKIKKGVKKLFSTKLGRIVGGIGLYMMMGAAAKRLSGWANSTFGKAASQASTEAVTNETLQQAATGLQETISSSKDLLNNIGNAKNNSEATNMFINAVETTAKEGTSNLIVDNTITGSIEKINNEIFLGGATESAKASRPVADFLVADSPKNIFESGQRFVKNTFEDIKNFELPENYIEDTTASLATGAIVSALSPEPEEPFISKGVAPRPQTTAAQAAYMQEIAPQFMAANNTTKLPNFNQLMQQNMYGTGTPQALQNLYADVNVLPLPQV